LTAELGLLLKEAQMLSGNLIAIPLAILAGAATAPSRAEDIVKVGIVMPMSGGFALAGRQVVAGIRPEVLSSLPNSPTRLNRPQRSV